ncbi:hypothetical protein PoB_000880400 [Plakobranchus ocellatus]|uniref:Uncharacterized protein n=1 Tax=Plakobranchus ocellatus TaxID=259542 RepID=A0AAV3YJS9_9GAST|nr:hypothetical protein PoB_000880400 [Plakobranchus ocellatus]
MNTVEMELKEFIALCTDLAIVFNTTDREGLCGQVSRQLGLYARLVNISATDQATLQRQLLNLRHTGSPSIWVDGVSVFRCTQARKPGTLHILPSVSHQTLSACVIIVSNRHLEQTRGFSDETHTFSKGSLTQKLGYLMKIFKSQEIQGLDESGIDDADNFFSLYVGNWNDRISAMEQRQASLLREKGLTSSDRYHAAKMSRSCTAL